VLLQRVKRGGVLLALQTILLGLASLRRCQFYLVGSEGTSAPKNSHLLPQPYPPWRLFAQLAISPINFFNSRRAVSAVMVFTYELATSQK
jgi:hypothetical protein